MQHEYKVGDKVIIDYCNIENLVQLKGKDVVGVIRHIMDSKSDTRYLVTSEACSSGLYCAIKCLACELDTNETDKIVITHDGKTTTAKLYNGKDVVKTATAKCSPEDKFDFITGANLAMERLVKEVKPISVGGFKVGDRVNLDGINGTIICINEVDDLGVEFDEPNGFTHNCGVFELKDGKRGTKNTSRWCLPDELTHGEVPTYYNGKVVCVDTCGRNQSLYTIGKIYEFVDGKLTDDRGWHLPAMPVSSFEEWTNHTGSKFIEIVE